MSRVAAFPLVVTSPEMQGPLVLAAQRALTFSDFGNFQPGPLDSVYGPETARAAYRAKFWHGYQEDNLSNVYGAPLHAFLTGTAEPDRGMERRRLERKGRAAITTPLRLKALAKMKEWVGTAEDPPGSNNIFVTRWYMDRPGGYTSSSKGPPYCMMTVTKAYVDVGARHFTKLRDGDRWAYVPTFLADARAGRYDLSVIRDPRPGDPVCFDWDGGVPDHVGLFGEWIVKGSTFISVEGNTRDGIFRRDNGRFPARSMSDVEAFVHVGR